MLCNLSQTYLTLAFDCGAVAIAAILYTFRAQVLANRSPETNFTDRVNAWIRVGACR